MYWLRNTEVHACRNSEYRTASGPDKKSGIQRFPVFRGFSLFSLKT